MPRRRTGSPCGHAAVARAGWAAEGFRSWPASDREPSRSHLATSRRSRGRDGDSTSCRHPRDDLDLVAAVNFGEMHADVVGRRSRDVLADKVGADRELAVPAVDEDRQADGAGTTVVDEFVHGGPDGPAREEDVVDQDDHTSVDGKRDLRLAYDRRVPDSGEVVAVERDVYRAEGNVRALVRTDGCLDAGRQRVTPR